MLMVDEDSDSYDADTMIGQTRRVHSKKPVLALVALVMLGGARACGETFSFAVIADPHINGSADHNAKFETAIDYIIRSKDSEDIQLVFVVGDIGWGGPRANRNLKVAKKCSTGSIEQISLIFPS